jgi:hypothetical protein|nr:MAG TPA: homing endonuclease [Bacteriophage sp.]
MEDIKLNLTECKQVEGYPFLYLLPDGKVYNSNSKRFIGGKHYHDKETDKYVNLVSLKRKMSNGIDLSGFKPIPEFPKYLINEYGTVYGTKNNITMKTFFDKGGYERITLRDDTGKKHTRSIHHLVLSTFNESEYKRLKDSYVKGQYDHLVVNHIDSNRTNNHISNLEVVTQQENIRHAIEHGNWAITPVMIKFLESGEVKYFEATTSASKYLGLDETTFRHRFDNPKYLNVVYTTGEHGDHQIKLATDPDFGAPIYFVDNGRGSSTGISVIDYRVSPFHEVIYKSFSDYSRKTGISTPTICRMFAKNNQPVLSNLHRLKMLDNFEEWVTTDPILDHLKLANANALVIMKEDGSEPPVISLVYNHTGLHGWNYHSEILELAIKHKPYKHDHTDRIFYAYSDFIKSKWFKKWGNRFGEYEYYGFKGIKSKL